MDPASLQSTAGAICVLAARQHGAVARRQLLELGCSGDWIAHRIARGRLHRVRRGVYAVGRPGPERLRAALDERSSRPGLSRLRATLDRRTFTLSDSELERRFLPLARSAGLPSPAPREHKVNGFDVDFFWPGLGLVVETDGLRYHRTPAQQVRDRVRDQTHAATGLTPLRFTRAQVRFEPAYVQATLAAVVRRLRTTRGD
ncbi:MAG: DUF559 domain-containing protein [Solirubrobacteraceae bacterium]